MSNVRKLMARLNASTCRFDIGRGGIPELTPQDIAGALGMMDNELAREVFCACWWPDGARLTADELYGRLRKAILDEYGRRGQAAAIAKLECNIAEGDVSIRRFLSEADKRALSSIRAKREKANAERWPWNIDVYSAMPKAVLNEIRYRSLCRECNGIGYITSEGSAQRACARCDGKGDAPASKVDRAKALGITESSYRMVWAAVYEWLLMRVSDLESVANVQFRNALGVADEADKAA